jgi:hypothetical protein
MYLLSTQLMRATTILSEHDNGLFGGFQVSTSWWVGPILTDSDLDCHLNRI